MSAATGAQIVGGMLFAFLADGLLGILVNSPSILESKPLAILVRRPSHGVVDLHRWRGHKLRHRRFRQLHSSAPAVQVVGRHPPSSRSLSQPSHAPDRHRSHRPQSR